LNEKYCLLFPFQYFIEIRPIFSAEWG